MKDNKPQPKMKTCIYCGKKWNVSVRNVYENYICPVCRTKNKHSNVERS